MVMWLFTGQRKLRSVEETVLRETKLCVACGGHVLRLAEREAGDPYHWIPCGYICSNCNAVHLRIS